MNHFSCAVTYSTCEKGEAYSSLLFMFLPLQDYTLNFSFLPPHLRCMPTGVLSQKLQLFFLFLSSVLPQWESRKQRQQERGQWLTYLMWLADPSFHPLLVSFIFFSFFQILVLPSTPMAMDNAREKKGSSKMEKLVKYACQLMITVTSRVIYGTGRATLCFSLHLPFVVTSVSGHPTSVFTWVWWILTMELLAIKKTRKKESKIFSTPCIVRENQ